MRLSAELYKQITAALRSDANPDSPRHEPRVGLAGEVTLINTSGPGPRAAKVRVRDVSRTGVGLYYSQRFIKGQKFILLLHSNSSKPIWLVCTAAHCERTEAERYAIGARITQVLRPEQVQKLQASNGVSMDFDQIVDVLRTSEAILA